MAIETSSLLGALRSALQWIPGMLVRWRFPPSRLANLLYVDLQPRNESVWLNLGEAAEIRLTLQVINLSPFKVELDRAQFKFVYAGAPITFNYLSRTKVAPAESVSLHLHEALTDGQANQILRNWQGNQPWIEGTLEVNCDVHSFTKNISSLTGLHVSVVNFDSRKMDA